MTWFVPQGLCRSCTSEASGKPMSGLSCVNSEVAAYKSLHVSQFHLISSFDSDVSQEASEWEKIDNFTPIEPWIPLNRIQWCSWTVDACNLQVCLPHWLSCPCQSVQWICTKHSLSASLHPVLSSSSARYESIIKHILCMHAVCTLETTFWLKKRVPNPICLFGEVYPDVHWEGTEWYSWTHAFHCIPNISNTFATYITKFVHCTFMTWTSSSENHITVWAKSAVQKFRDFSTVFFTFLHLVRHAFLTHTSWGCTPQFLAATDWLSGCALAMTLGSLGSGQDTHRTNPWASQCLFHRGNNPIFGVR